MNKIWWNLFLLYKLMQQQYHSIEPTLYEPTWTMMRSDSWCAFLILLLFFGLRKNSTEFFFRMYKKFRKWVMSQLTTCRLPPPPPPSKVAIMVFCSKRVEQCSIVPLITVFFYRPNFFFYEINSFPFFSFWDMAPNTWIFTKKWPKLPKKMYIPKNCAMFWNECRTDFKIFAIFSFWDMVDFVLKVLSELWTRAVSQVKICTHPPPPSEIVRFS